MSARTPGVLQRGKPGWDRCGFDRAAAGVQVRFARMVPSAAVQERLDLDGVAVDGLDVMTVGIQDERGVVAA